MSKHLTAMEIQARMYQYRNTQDALADRYQRQITRPLYKRFRNHWLITLSNEGPITQFVERLIFEVTTDERTA